MNGLLDRIARLRRRLDAARFGTIDPSAKIGKRGEQAAAVFLRRKGLRIISESESDRGGEIDLIALDRRGSLMVFVEVKTTESTKPGHPAERVTSDKQARIARAALRYMKRNQVLGMPVRFDVVAVWWAGGGRDPDRIEHYESAFENPAQYQMF